jgi:hypothetical protein
MTKNHLRDLQNYTGTVIEMFSSVPQKEIIHSPGDDRSMDFQKEIICIRTYIGLLCHSLMILMGFYEHSLQRMASIRMLSRIASYI